MRIINTTIFLLFPFTTCRHRQIAVVPSDIEIRKILSRLANKKARKSYNLQAF